jgi:hypothetical protein
MANVADEPLIQDWKLVYQAESRVGLGMTVGKR